MPSILMTMEAQLLKVYKSDYWLSAMPPQNAGSNIWSRENILPRKSERCKRAVIRLSIPPVTRKLDPGPALQPHLPPPEKLFGQNFPDTT